MGGEGEGDGRVGPLEQRPVPGERVEGRGNVRGAPVRAEPVRARRVEGDEEEVPGPLRPRAGGEEEGGGEEDSGERGAPEPCPRFPGPPSGVRPHEALHGRGPILRGPSPFLERFRRARISGSVAPKRAQGPRTGSPPAALGDSRPSHRRSSTIARRWRPGQIVDPRPWAARTPRWE